MITSLYAVLLTVIFLILSARVIMYRRATQQGLGDHGDKSLMKRMRAQGNFAEYVPFGLVLMVLVELQAPGARALHLIGGLLLLGRMAHGYGFSASPPSMRLRVAGTALTLTSYIVAILCLTILAVSPL